MSTYNFTKLGLTGYWYKPSDWKNVEIAGEYHYRGGKGQGITQYVNLWTILFYIMGVEEEL